MTYYRYNARGAAIRTPRLDFYKPGQSSIDWSNTALTEYGREVDYDIESMSEGHIATTGHKHFIHIREHYEWLLSGTTCEITEWKRMNNSLTSYPYGKAVGANSYLYCWAYRDGVRPIGAESFDITRVDTDDLMRRASHAFFNQNDMMGLVNIIELESTMRIVPSFLSDTRKCLAAAYKVLHGVRPSKSLGIKILMTMVERGVREIRTSSSLVKSRGSSSGRNTALVSSAREAGRRTLRNVKAALKPCGLVVANTHLAYSFGVKPLIKDVQTCLQKAIRKAVHRRRGSAVMRTTSRLNINKLSWHWSTADMGFVPTNVFDYPYRTGSFLHPHKEQVETEVRAVIVGKIEFPDGGLLDPVRQFAANGPVSLALELIPLSFVVQWFVDLNSVVDRLDVWLQGGRFEIENSTVSYKFNDTINGVVHPIAYSASMGATNAPQDGVTAITSRVNYYERFGRDIPSGVAFSPRFAKKQALLSASLAAQRIL